MKRISKASSPEIDLPNFKKNNLLSVGSHLGLQYVVQHNNLGYRCGYVRIPKQHPWFDKNNYEEIDVDCHGGLTYSDYTKDKKALWIGFDCGHAGDLVDERLLDDSDPERKNFARAMARLAAGYETIKDTEYVEKECKRICKQASKAVKGD